MIGFLVLVLIVSSGLSPIYAQTMLDLGFSQKSDLYEFGYKLHPQKLLENTEGIILVYVISNEKIVPTPIKGMKVSSSDNSIIQIQEVQNDSYDYSAKIKILAMNPGIANIALAAPGFKSQQISVPVFNNNNHPTQILLKSTPNDFPVDGPKFGFIGIEIATTGGLPTKADKDTFVKLSTPNTDIIKLNETEIKIAKGEYYAVSKFDIIASGDAIIFAESEGMKKISEFIHVREAVNPLQIQLYVYPKNFNSFNSQMGYAIIQLQDGEGIPVKADGDIIVTLDVENPDSDINTSHDYEEFLFSSDKLVIKQGKYSAYTSFTVRPNLSDFTSEFEQNYNFFATADNYISKGDSITVTHDEMGMLEGAGPAVTVPLPFLTSGEREIVAVSYLETEIEVARQLDSSAGSVVPIRERITITVPVMADGDVIVKVSSSNLDTVNTDDVIFNKGANTALIFGNTGTVIPEENSSLEFYITDSKQVSTVIGEPHGPLEEDLNLTVELLIPKILAGESFPLLGYLVETEEETEETTTSESDEEEEDGRIGVTHFIKDTVLTFSADEYFEISSEIIKQNQEYAQTVAKSIKVGSSSLTAQAAGLETSIILDSYSTDPTRIELSFSENILPMTSNLVSAQLLDSVGNPVYAKTPIELKFVSNNQDVIKLPESIIIEESEYYKYFVVESNIEGITEVSVLADDLPMENYQFTVAGIHPQITIMAPNSIDEGNSIIAELSIQYPGIDLPLENYQVDWTVLGGNIQESDSTTNLEGKSKLTVNDVGSDNVEIHATINGLGFTNLEYVKKIKVIPLPIDQVIPEENSEDNVELSLIDENNLVFFIIPGAVGAAILYLRKTNRLEGISEKLDILERFERIRERVSEIRER